MQGIERDWCDVCIKAVIAGYRNLLNAPALEALARTRYGKEDTRGSDAITEITIKGIITEHDQQAILITEERELDEIARKRWPIDADPIRQPMILFSDPTDRSTPLDEFLRAISKDHELEKVGKLMGRSKSAKIWEGMHQPPASITGATSSITAIRKGEIIFSVILNFITHTIFIATPFGVYQMLLPHFDDHKLNAVNLECILEHGRMLTFPPASVTCRKYDDQKRFVTFIGKTGYRECFENCMIFVEELDKFLHHDNPGGPSRVLYLSNLHVGYGPIGFIVANGEKIGEWIHWLAFVKFMRNHQTSHILRVFEVYTDRPYYKDDVLMSTSPSYSIFRTEGGITTLDISRLRYSDRPSKFRSMIVVTLGDNGFIIPTMIRHGYREISSAF